MMGMSVEGECRLCFGKNHLCFGKCRLCKVSYRVGVGGWVGVGVVFAEHKEWLGRAIQY